MLRNMNRTWSCEKCQETFRTSKLLRAHRKSHAPKLPLKEPGYKFDPIQDLYVCTTCSAEFQNQNEAEKHVIVHEEIFRCEVCNEQFERAYNLGIHLSIHGADTLFKCPLCTFKTPKSTSLLTHINHMHLRKFYYSCPTCGKGFNDAVFFKEHENEHLGVRPFVCVVCNKDFIYSRYLHSHQIRNHRVGIDGELLPNQCNVCMKTFSKMISLQKHLQGNHVRSKIPAEKKHLCDLCGKGFARRNKLMVHYRVHTGVKPYVCSYCSKSFTKKDYLVMHERVHSGEKPYSCEYCGKCFSQGAPLRIHLRGHTGERPYVCNFCNNGFASRGALNIHCKSCKGGV